MPQSASLAHAAPENEHVPWPVGVVVLVVVLVVVVVVAMPDVVERFQTLGTYTRDLTPAQTAEFMRSEERLWWPIVRQVNQKR